MCVPRENNVQQSSSAAGFAVGTYQSEQCAMGRHSTGLAVIGYFSMLNLNLMNHISQVWDEHVKFRCQRQGRVVRHLGVCTVGKDHTKACLVFTCRYAYQM